MIISRVVGGLGNQLYIWANARSLELNGYDSCLDISHYKNQVGITVRNFSLDLFPNLKYKLWNGTADNVISVNDDFNYKKLIINNNYSYYLNGYWQTEEYFKENEHQIRTELLPNSDIQMKLVSKYPGLLKDSVSLHVRRTDYVNQQHNHPVQSIEYYERGLSIIGDYDVLYIFSDDIEWCRSNLKFDKMVFINNDSDVEDLWLMSMCKHNIIANSSFSWWGAYLNSNPDKKVIAPLNWFGASLNLSTKDLIPKGWIRI